MRSSWSPTRSKLYASGKGLAPELQILFSVVEALDRFVLQQRGFSDMTAFLAYGTVSRFAAVVANITEIIPVGRGVIHGYQSWLYRLPSKKHGIWIAVESGEHDYVSMPGFGDWQKTGPFLLDYVTIIGHEIGHVARGHKGVEVSKVSALRPFPPMGIPEEWEAWLWAEYLRAFVLADYSAKTKRKRNVDLAPSLFLHRRCHDRGP